MGLTNLDINELTTYFRDRDLSLVVAGETIRAQTYDPRSPGSYDVATDMRLANLVTAALRNNASDASRVKRTLGHMIERDTLGRRHYDVLQRAFGPLPPLALPLEEFRYPEVAARTATALARGHELAVENERARQVEATYEAARQSGCSGMVAAARVYATERRLAIHGVRVRDADVHYCARRSIERALSPRDERFIAQVRKEMLELVNVAGDAYRAAREDLGATKRKAQARKRQENEAFYAELVGKRRRKESQRFWSKIARQANASRVRRAS